MIIFSAIKNIYKVLLCYVYACIYGRARTRNIQPKKIIVMPASRLGDMVCATPIFHAIKNQYPDCKVIVVGLNNCSTVHDHNPDVDEYMTIGQNDLFGNVKKIKEIGAYVAVVTTPSFEAVAMLFRAGVKTIIGPRVINGFCPYQTKSYRLLRPLFISINHRMRQYAPREYLYMLEPLGIHSNDSGKHVGFSDGARQRMRDYLIGQKVIPGSDFIIGISISAGNKIKKWPGHRFAEVADVLSSMHGAIVVFIGGKGDVAETAEIIRVLKQQTRCVDMTGKCSIDELKALMSLMNLFVSVDTGPIYIAEALNIPTVDITGPIDENEQPPIGPRHKVVHITDRKGPELFVMNARVYNEKEAKRQVEEITVESVVAAADELIYAIKSNK